MGQRMKISEMIEKLKAIESEIGDCEVYRSSNCGNYAYAIRLSIGNVGKNNHNKFVSRGGVKCVNIT